MSLNNVGFSSTKIRALSGLYTDTYDDDDDDDGGAVLLCFLFSFSMLCFQYRLAIQNSSSWQLLTYMLFHGSIETR